MCCLEKKTSFILNAIKQILSRSWVELMAPVFSKAAWRCAWYMLQNDLIHAWGLDFQLGYCAQSDRTKNVGVVDSEYIVHLGLPTLGVLDGTKEPSGLQRVNNRTEVSPLVSL
ncbi:uncharacterized protein LOC114268094 isoform X1 [Camellia sinensis]|uniref:uncharacterized protein LOC114268094 isoform X1 n=2 Tax=Camellia sinensis TaxID=4442 RepID=UPI001035A30C|nr:uncharacterized protein LOC114268094 isoform X1 [Camellia sinensis]